MRVNGKIDFILFPKKGQPQPDNGFTIASLKPDGGGDKIIIKGYIPGIRPEMNISVTGDMKADKFGNHLAVSSYEEIVPTSTEGIKNYLASGLISGLGDRLAERIVDEFGAGTMWVIENEPERLMDVRGISKKKMQMVVSAWAEQQAVKDVMVFLKTYNVGNAYAAKIYKEYGADTISILRNNPYVMADDIKGIGFLSADTIAMAMGIDRRSPDRIRSAILYVMKESSEKEGHVYHTAEQLTKNTLAVLNNGDVADESLVTEGDIADRLEGMKDSRLVISDEDRLYLPMYYFAEKNVAQRISLLCKEKVKPHPIDFDVLERRNDIEYDSVQKDAITLASGSRFCVITGGPGTGKTTTMKGVIDEARSRGLRILLAAPTGRASRRLAETTGAEAKTIHRLLEYKMGDGFGRDDKNPLSGDLLVVDESSMIDTMLMHSLLKAVPLSMRVVLVGDVDQLPSVGAGNILRDIIESECVPVVRLKRIFRQAQNSLIVSNAHAVNEGCAPALPCNLTPQGEDFCFVERDDVESIQTDIINLVSGYIPDQFGYKWDDIQVLTPMKKGPLGTLELNRILQNKLNPSNDRLRYGDIEFRVGDRIMQTKNNYDWDVFNGDIGKVMSIDTEDKSMVLRFGDDNFVARGDQLSTIDLAYACTIHKSQGSEYPVVVVPSTMSHYIMLQRNLLYTAITRAKEKCVMVGNKQAVMTMVNNNVVLKRNTALEERLRGYFGKDVTRVVEAKPQKKDEEETVFVPVSRSDGRMNYTDNKGHFLLKRWVDEASPFDGGVAKVMYGGQRFAINDKGCVVTREERIVQQTLFPVETKGPRP